MDIDKKLASTQRNIERQLDNCITMLVNHYGPNHPKTRHFIAHAKKIEDMLPRFLEMDPDQFEKKLNDIVKEMLNDR